MIQLPSDERGLLRTALELVEQCRSSVGLRAAYYRVINAIAETGRSDGTKSLINMMDNHLDRTAGHLYSPTDLRFTLGFTKTYDKNTQDRASAVGRALTKSFKKGTYLGTDMLFGRGVKEGLKYGACILKQWPEIKGRAPRPVAPGSDIFTDDKRYPVYQSSLVMPWQFGVYREDLTDINKQPVLCETTALSMPEVWRRIYHLPDADALYKRIQSNSATGGTGYEPTNFFHQVLSTSVLDTSGVESATRPLPGGIVQLANDPNYSIMGPQITVPMAIHHELWVQGDDDYVTLQLFEPDILITRYKKSNLLISGDHDTGIHPYTLIQPNEKTGYFWGQSELSDLMAPQRLLSSWADDIQRLFGLQVDKILAFSGYDGLTDEQYDQFRGAGFFNSPNPAATVTDLTPKFPPEAIPMLKLIMEIMNQIGGFPNILQGQGDVGVRSNEQAATLLKTGSPRLRDRSLIVERQCAMAGATRLALMEAKDGTNYWTNGNSPEDAEKSKFLLTNIPRDREVEVDSHSSSPIFQDDHAQLTAFGVKAGFLDGEDAIDDLPYPEKEKKKMRLRERQKAAAINREEMLKKYPELGETIAKRSITGKGGTSS